MNLPMRRFLVLVCLGLTSAGAATNAAPITIDWVTVGDPGNAADDTGYGAVAASFQIMKYEMTNSQYVAFLNAVAATDTYSLYNVNMTDDARGGITRSGTSGGYTYAAKANMGDKPVMHVSWFDVARMANWLQNGQGGAGSTETGAYTLVGGQTSGTAPVRNAGATFYIPTENQWYKAAYYKGGGTNAGYWDFATQSDTAPAAVTANSVGVGSAGSVGNFANSSEAAIWNDQSGNVTTVGTNGGASAYGAFDLSGNVFEWTDADGLASSLRVLRGGSWDAPAALLSSADARYPDESTSYTNDFTGFRLVSPVPEPSALAMVCAGLACGAFMLRHRGRRAEPRFPLEFPAGSVPGGSYFERHSEENP